MVSRIVGVIASAALALAASAVAAATPQQYAQQLERAARAEDARFAGFSAQRGREFFMAKHGGEWTCSSCHTDDPRAQGRHVRTGKAITPLAPAANAERFTDAAFAEKWFKRNCGDVAGRACTPTEKGDVLAFLLSLTGASK
jgi:hypothetical protein